jgi:signal peptidase I
LLEPQPEHPIIEDDLQWDQEELLPEDALETAEEPGIPFGKKVLRFFFEVVQMVMVVFLLYQGVDALIGRVQVESISMLDTVKPGELLMVSKLAYRNSDRFQRGDVIVFHAPKEPGEDYIKRLIGLPGDTVRVESGLVFVNGVLLSEPYIRERPTYEGEWMVPPGNLFVMGDNRNLSADSHEWGFLPIENVFGRAFLIYWPPNEVNLLKRIDPAAAVY